MRYTVEVTGQHTKWFKEGTDVLHREDGPAIEYADESKYWYQDDKLHRLDGPAVIHADGDKYWYQNGGLHRADGPAIEYANGDKAWYQNDALHREDGPAVEYHSGNTSYYLRGVNYSKTDFLNKIKSLPFTGKIVEIDGRKFRLTEVND